ncbi:hypothetical protein M527_01115 [Sphingobium indicum IP26]|nr:hypothetical protein M527_01115 [Sphingobium indicum IP26]
MAHLISDYASKCIYEDGHTRQRVLDELDRIRAIWPTFDAFVIEISALREPFAKHGDRTIVVNNFSARDQEKYADIIMREAAVGLSLPVLKIDVEILSPSALIKRMAAIRQTLGQRPIIWVSHQRPPSTDPEYETVNKVRSHLSVSLKAGAQALSDMFFDPSTIAAEMGQEVFFQGGGRDLDHLTQEAAKVLSARYAAMLIRTLQIATSK